MEGGGQGGQAANDEELELQMAIALSLAESQNYADDPPGASMAANPSATRSDGAGPSAFQQVAGQQTTGAQLPTSDLQSLLAAALTASLAGLAQQPGAAAAAPIQPAPAQPPPQPAPQPSQPVVRPPPPPQPAPVPQPAPQPAPAPAAQQQQMTMLQQLLQAGLASAMSGSGSGASAPTQSRPGSAVPRSAARSLTAVVPPPPLPAWTKPLTRWWEDGVPTASSLTPVPFPVSADLGGFVDVMTKAIGAKVAAPTAGVTVDGAVVNLKPTQSSGTFTITVTDLEQALRMWLLRPSMAASGISQFRALHDAYDALPASGHIKEGPVRAAADMLSAVIGRMAFNLLAHDEADLYDAQGQYTSEFLRDLKTPGRRGAGMCGAFMEALVTAVETEQQAKAAERLLRLVLAEFKSLAKLGQSAVELEPLLLMLDVATSPTRMQRCLVALLLADVQQVSGLLLSGQVAIAGPQLESTCVLGPMLALSSFVDPVSALRHSITSKAKDTFATLKGYPTNIGEIETAMKVLQSSFSRLQDAAHLLMKRLITLKLPVTGPGGAGARESFLSWVVAVIEANQPRTNMGETGIKAQAATELTAGGSDAFTVNVTAVLLRFARPFVQGYLEKSPKFTDLFEKHLSPSYYRTQPHRIGDTSKASPLAGESGAADEPEGPQTAGQTPTSSSPHAATFFAPDEASSSAPSFIADVFFLTQRALHVGLLPAYFRYARMAEVVYEREKQALEGGEDGAGTSKARPVMLQYNLLHHCSMAALAEPQLLEDSVTFCILQVLWLRNLVNTQPSAFKHIPSYTLSDSVSWLQFVIQSGHAVHVASKDIGSLVEALATLLDAQHCVRSTLLADKISSLLMCMIGPQLDVGKRLARTASLAPTAMRPGEAALVASVLNCPAATSGGLVPALMRAYVAADHVVGLDVDRHAFDKFTFRSRIDMILEELWRDDRCRSRIVAVATSKGESSAPATGAPADVGAAFVGYAGCLLNSIIYLFKDSLGRLRDIAKVEASKAEAGEGWKARSDSAQQDAFLRSQQHTTRGFMRMANSSINWLNILAQHPQAGAAFSVQPLGGRAAYALLHFTELLVGEQAVGIVVENPGQYMFDVPQLLESVLNLLLRLAAAQPAFVSVVASEPDLDVGVLQQALDALEKNHQVMAATQLKQFMDALSAAGCPATASGGAAGTTPSVLRTSGAPSGTAEGGIPPSSPPAKRSKLGDGVGSEGSGALDGDGDTAMGDAAGSMSVLTMPGPDLSGDELVSAYKEALGELGVGTFDMGAPRAYHSSFAAMAAEATGAPPAKMKRINREIRDLNGRAPLPCDPRASIFLRYDAEHLDVMRALLTGPEGTPYAYGCFVFDLYYPNTYPNTAMLLNFETTGQGRARFNPNLYADGKVCLSLINTWHASHESEKWNPEQTTTFQVLVSVQAMILVEDPYYNEPAHEAARGTDTGKTSAAAYNAELTLNTLRWAMIDKLRNPPPGFEEVVTKHFKLLRHKLMAVARGWASAAEATGNTLLAKRTQAAVQELHGLLAAL